MGGFKKFLLRGNLVDLAVAVVIGLAFAAVVTALVTDLITPLIAAIGGKPDFSSLTFTLNHSKFRYGSFINALIAFLIIAAVIYYFVVVPANRITVIATRNTEAAERSCPECLSKIPAAARRCMFCTTVVEPHLNGHKAPASAADASRRRSALRRPTLRPRS